ncbi:hypothetical protein [Atopomonas sediminilitoris]|uniref:hypothetical protein n=1 Tax=Atopomonas sediminilitoris TaxID=2919919 RepID=UPI001F4EC84F|nr:hypothetical protein [Atopomonas sediminilitoris]MCJ8170342.1 hypothetical protein [Atopomonas sediminilitoris]
MQVSGSALSAGLSGVQAGQRRIDQAASDIARQTLPQREEVQQAQAEQANRPDPANSAPPVRTAEPTSAVADSLVELREGQTEAQAGAQVIKTADEVLGTLVDVRA